MRFCARSGENLQSVRRKVDFAHGVLLQQAGDLDGGAIIWVFILRTGTLFSCSKSFWDLPLAECTPGHINPRTTQKSVVLGFAPSRRPYKASQSQNDLEQRLCADRMTVLFCKNGDAGLAPFTTEIDCCRIIRCFECSLIVLEFLNSHIRSKNALPHTFPSSSYTSGKRMKNARPKPGICYFVGRQSRVPKR